MREPRWLRGAYAQAPHVERDSGWFRGRANVEAWRGTPAELLSVAHELRSHVGGDEEVEVSGVVTWSDATHQSFQSLDDMQTQLGGSDLERVLALRIDCASPDGGMVGALVARPQIPGVMLEVVGADKSRVMGLSELAFQQMMIGYVDRMGGWRALAWMLSAIAPVVLVSIAVSPGQASLAARIGVIVAAGLGSMATFFVIGPYFQISRGLELVSSIPESRSRQAIMLLLRVYRNRHTRVVLGVLGTLALGVIGNKLSDLLPWP